MISTWPPAGTSRRGSVGHRAAPPSAGRPTPITTVSTIMDGTRAPAFGRASAAEIVVRGTSVIGRLLQEPSSLAENGQARMDNTADIGYLDSGATVHRRTGPQGHDHHRRSKRLLGPRWSRYLLASPGTIGDCASSGCPTRSGARGSPAVSCKGTPRPAVTADEVRALRKEAPRQRTRLPSRSRGSGPTCPARRSERSSRRSSPGQAQLAAPLDPPRP